MRRLALFAALLTIALPAVAQVGMGGSGVSLATLKTYRSAYAAAKKALQAKPKDKKARSTFVAATNRLATGTMVAEGLPPKQRYPAALRLYREVLKIDPTNHEAKNNSEMIVAVYKSMHRPIPK